MSEQPGPVHRLGVVHSSPGAPAAAPAPPAGPTASDSGIVASPSPASAGDPDGVERAFRRSVADLIHVVLTKGYVTRRDFVRGEAARRGLSVEWLLAEYLARTIMDRVDREYR
jgi:hypothetical protein